MTNVCVFCGMSGDLTLEHLYGQWLKKANLSQEHSRHTVGRHNNLGRELGTFGPFDLKVKDVCRTCNNGWMSRLESDAQRSVTPMLEGIAMTIARDDLGALSKWFQKTALVAMLVVNRLDPSPEPFSFQTDYRTLYELRHQNSPTEDSQFWMGQYSGKRQFASSTVTPIVVGVQGLDEPEWPQGYAFTTVVGSLIFYGVRIFEPLLQLHLEISENLQLIWPNVEFVSWPPERAVDDNGYIRLTGAKTIVAENEGIVVGPWRPATELPESRLVRGNVEISLPCERHIAYYPGELVTEAMIGHYYAFATSCACENAYLINTERDGAHIKAVGSLESIAVSYENIDGTEMIMTDVEGIFFAKRI